jgi:D-glycero-alpha-D-manno-heptose-7-phosphate kinase
LERQLVVCHTGKSRLSGDLISTVMGAYRAGVPETTPALHRLRAIAGEMKSALLKGGLGSFGELLLENWVCKKSLVPSITNEHIDSLLDQARGAGAIGGKVPGAGGGGCLLFCGESDRERLVRKVIETAGSRIIDFNFDAKGLQTWVQG